MPTFNFKELADRISTAPNLDVAWSLLAAAPEDFIDGRALDIGTSMIALVIASRFAELDPAEQSKLGDAVKWATRIALCSTADQDPETRYGIQQIRENVGDWLRKLPWEHRSRLTPEITSLAIASLARDNWKQACWLLSSVGWRDPLAEEALWKGSHGIKTERADLFFCTLLDLGVPETKRSLYLAEAHQRYRDRKNRSNIHSIYILADVSSLQVLRKELPKGNQTENDKMVWLFLPQTIAHIANRKNTEKEASQAIDLLEVLLDHHAAETQRSIFLGGTVVPKCNSRKAVRLLLELVTKEVKAKEQNSLMLLVRRLEECVGSNQVRALNLSRNKIPLKKLFKKVLTKENEYKGRDLTFDADVKDHLWNLCLALGTDKADAIGYSLIEADENPYTQFKVLADLACLSLHPLPPRIVRWASEPATPNPDNTGTDEIQRMESIRVVASAGTIEAFRVLLHSEYTTLLGHTLADSADGLAYLAVTLGRQEKHRDYVIKELFDVLENGPKGPQPGAVSSALSDLAYVGLLNRSHFQRIIRYLLEEPDWTQKPVVKARLVAALSAAPAQLITEELIAKLESWAELPDRLLSTSCLETLIKQGQFPGRIGRLDARLKFDRPGSSHNLQPRDPNDVNGGIYAMLAYRDPEKYRTDFASYLEGCAFSSLVEAVETLGRLQSKEPSAAVFLSDWAEALIRRAIANNTRYNSESYLFDLLRKQSPMQLATTPWADHTAKWTAETREALATALGSLPVDAKSGTQVTGALTALLNDTHFGVRRAAFRSLSRLAPELLGAIADSLAKSASPGSRKLATEAVYWVPVDLRNRTDWRKLVLKLREDPAKEVRDALWKSEQSARKIEWAQKYQEALLAVATGSNTEVLKAWKFASAIAHVGDDETTAALGNFLKSKNLPANFQRFLIRTIHALEKNWDKCRKKWPEPFALGSATTKTGTGTVTIDGIDLPVDYLVWERPDVLQPTILSWGGTVKTPGQIKPDLMGRQLLFTDAGGISWEIWVHSINFPSNFSFVGGDRVPHSTS